jgi:hypothetical protein
MLVIDKWTEICPQWFEHLLNDLEDGHEGWIQLLDDSGKRNSADGGGERMERIA